MAQIIGQELVEDAIFCQASMAFHKYHFKEAMPTFSTARKFTNEL